MSKLDELIEKYCPNGVEYKELRDISTYAKNRVDAKTVDDKNYVGVDNLLPNKHGKTSSSYVPKGGNLIGFNQDDILIGNIRPYLKKIWLAEYGGATNGDVLTIQILTRTLDPKFLYYCLSSDQFFCMICNMLKGQKCRGVIRRQ